MPRPSQPTLRQIRIRGRATDDFRVLKKRIPKSLQIGDPLRRTDKTNHRNDPLLPGIKFLQLPGQRQADQKRGPHQQREVLRKDYPGNRRKLKFPAINQGKRRGTQ